jgi:hypothetical protein
MLDPNPEFLPKHMWSNIWSRSKFKRLVKMEEGESPESTTTTQNVSSPIAARAVSPTQPASKNQPTAGKGRGPAKTIDQVMQIVDLPCFYLIGSVSLISTYSFAGGDQRKIRNGG